MVYKTNTKNSTYLSVFCVIEYSYHTHIYIMYLIHLYIIKKYNKIYIYTLIHIFYLY